MVTSVTSCWGVETIRRIPSGAKAGLSHRRPDREVAMSSPMETPRDDNGEPHPFAESFAWLSGGWVRSEWLTQTALCDCRERFVSNPARILLLEHFLHDAVAARISRFLTSEATHEERFGLYGPNGSYMVTEGEWTSAPRDRQFYRAGRLADVRPEFQLSPNLLTFLRLRKAIT